MAVNLDEAEKRILGTLLVDFTDRELDAHNLKSGYKGPLIPDLSATICDGADITKVDFDVAFADLEKKKLIKTGPYEAYKNTPGRGMVFLGVFSKREYAGLTELGYKTARQAPNRPSKVQRVVNNVHISGGQFTNMQLATGNNVVQTMEFVSGQDSEILSNLISILEKQGQVISLEQRSDLTSAIREANDGNGKGAKSLLEKVCGPAWSAVQPVIWPIFGDIIKKSLDL